MEVEEQLFLGLGIAGGIISDESSTVRPARVYSSKEASSSGVLLDASTTARAGRGPRTRRTGRGIGGHPRRRRPCRHRPLTP